MTLTRRIITIPSGISRRWSNFWSFIYGVTIFRALCTKIGNDPIIRGIPVVDISRKGGELIVGNHFSLNSGMRYNRIGRQQRSMLIVGDNASLTIGNNVGMSSIAIVCMKRISIGNNVKIGGNTVIYDTDFHSMDSGKRSMIPEDLSDVKTAMVTIGDDVFIGAHTTILKGTTIGDNSVIGAGSVVRGNIPGGEIWFGNPARFIRRIDL